jgi:hypothetical protein
LAFAGSFSIIGMAGCLQLFEEQTTASPQNGEPATTDAGDSRDNSSLTTDRVELSVIKSFDINTSHAWFDRVNVCVLRGSDVTALHPNGVRWQKETDGATGGRAFASKAGTAVFGFDSPDHLPPDAAAQFRAYNSADEDDR